MSDEASPRVLVPSWVIVDMRAASAMLDAFQAAFAAIDRLDTYYGALMRRHQERLAWDAKCLRRTRMDLRVMAMHVEDLAGEIGRMLVPAQGND